MKIQSNATTAVTATVVLATLLLPLLPVPAYWLSLGNYIGLYSIVVVGLVLLTGIGGLTSFGQAAFVGLGAYTTAYLTTAHGLSPWLTLFIGLAISGGSALFIGAITVRLSGHFLPLATIAWGLSLYYLFGTVEFLGKYDGLTGIPPLSVAGFALDRPSRMFGLIWLCVFLCVWISHNILYSRPGRVIRALQGGAAMAEAMGADTTRAKLSVFVMAALMASLSGWLYAHLQRSVNATPFGLHMGIEYLFMAVVGGIGHLWGALAGAGVMAVLKSVLQDWIPKLTGGSGHYEVIVFGALIVLLLQRAAHGLWPYVRDKAARWLPVKQVAVAPAAPPAGFDQLPRRTRPERGQVVLDVRAAKKQFGGLVAVNEVSFQVHAGEIVGLIGPNGAGKSTMFNLISGVLPLSSGEVHFKGERIDGAPSRRIVSLGIGRTFQHVKLMPQMTVLENVALGAHLRGQAGLGQAVMQMSRAEEDRLLYLSAEQIRRVGLGDLMYEQAGNLALGQQRILEIARALCTDPDLLLLDEPAAGLRLKEKEQLARLLSQLRAEGMAVLIVEHDMDFVMELTDRLVVMEFGTRIAEGVPKEVQQHPAVLAAYLGGLEIGGVVMGAPA